MIYPAKGERESCAQCAGGNIFKKKKFFCPDCSKKANTK